MSKYGCIVADPPWPYRSARAMPVRPGLTKNRYGGNVSAGERYGAMTLKELCALPVSNITAPSAHLYLWFTNSFAVEAHTLARAWGFEPKTILTWVKVKIDGTPSMKMGYYFRSATEHILFAVKGSQRLLDNTVSPTAYMLPREPHSRKPDFFFQLARRNSPGPFLELFSRDPRIGFDTYGKQATDPITLL